MLFLGPFVSPLGVTAQRTSGNADQYLGFPPLCGIERSPATLRRGSSSDKQQTRSEAFHSPLSLSVAITIESLTVLLLSKNNLHVAQCGPCFPLGCSATTGPSTVLRLTEKRPTPWQNTPES